jgi:hypothetical protein
MRHITSFAASIATVILTAMITPACAQVLSYLPDVIAAVQDGAAIVDAIERFCIIYFAQHPDPVASAKVFEAIDKTRAALDLALRTAQAAKSLDDQSVNAAFDQFKQAYLALLVLVRPYGVQEASLPGPLALRAQPGVLIVPQPIVFHPLRPR